MSRLSVLPVRDRSELRRFLDVEWQVRHEDEAWAPHLRSDVAARLKLRRNPFWHRAAGALFLARRGSVSAGRIVVAVDRLGPADEAAFGFFECVPGDRDAAAVLVEAAAREAGGEGASSLVGPWALPAFPEEAGLPEGDRDEEVLEALGFRRRERVGGEARPLSGDRHDEPGPVLRARDVARAVVAAAPRLVGALGWEVTAAEARAKLARLRSVLDPELAVVGEEGVAVAVPDTTSVRRAVTRGAGPVELARLAAAARKENVGAVTVFATCDGPLDALARRAAAAGYRRLGETGPPRWLWQRDL